MPEPHEITILVVDDNEIKRYGVVRVLRQAGFRILEASTGEEGLRLAAECPDLVVLDVKLPGISGFEVCQRIKSDPDLAGIKILHVSATYIDSDHRVEGLARGADGYLVQPVDPDELVETVRALLRLREAENSSRRTAREWRATFDALTDGILLVDARGTVLRCNRAMKEIICKPFHDIVGAAYQDALPQALAAALEDIPRAASPLPCEVAYEEHQYLISISPVLDEQEQATGFVYVFTDVTERNRTEEALRRSTTLIQAISDTTGDVVFAKDRDGRLIFANPATLALIGKPLDEVLGRTDAEFLEDKDVARTIMDNDRRIMKSGIAEDLEEVVPLPDGTPCLWFSRKMPYRDENGSVVGLLGVSRDITERKQVELELFESRQLLRSTMDHFPTVIAFKDREGRFLDVNWVVEQTLGMSKERIIGLTDYDIASKENADRYRQFDLEVMETRQPMQREEVTETPHGILHHLDISFPLIDAYDNVYGVGHISHDITEQKRLESELRERAEALAAADRAKDDFLAMLAHELRNPLSAIGNAGALIEMKANGQEALRKPVEILNRQVKHTARLVDDLLDVSRITRGKLDLRRELQDLAEVVRRAAEAGRPQMDAACHEFTIAIPSVPLWVDGDAARLEQVIGNLLNNAAKYTDPGGRITLSVWAEDGEAVIQVRDNGQGISPEMLPRIFDMFAQEDRSLVRSKGGMGIGLTLVQKLVQMHDGTIEAHSDGPGLGSEFIIRLRLMDDTVSALPSGPPDRAEAGTSRRILLVEDNVDAAVALADILEAWGHKVQVAYDGSTALEIAARQAPEIVLLDIGLPEMDGYEVARALRNMEATAAAHIVALTGYGQDADQQRARQAGFDHHVVKPLDMRKLRDVLAQHRG